MFGCQTRDRQSFSFIQISDTHIGAPHADSNLISFVGQINQVKHQPDFIINTGDVTDWGQENEWKLYDDIIKKSGVEFYNLPGNHDTRWSDNGKRYFKSLYGQPYRSFTYKSIHFILLDSSVLLEQYGHLSRKMLEWLKQDLLALNQSMPIILAIHHPPFLDKKFISNQTELLIRLKSYNVILFLTGHGHHVSTWQVNGIDFVMGDGLMDRDGSWLNIDIKPESLYVWQQNLSGGKRAPVLAKKLARTASTVDPISITGVDTLADKQICITFRNEGIDSVCWQVDDQQRITLENIEHIQTLCFDPDTLDPGVHTLCLVGYKNKINAYEDFVEFQTGKTASEVVETSAGFQAPLLLEDSCLFAGNNEGEFLALNILTEEIIWKRQLPDGVVARAATHDSLILVSCLDGKVYALNREDGEVVWYLAAAKSWYAEPLVVSDTIYVGNGDGYMYCLSAKDGSVIWQYATWKLIKNRAAYADGKIVFGGWDNYVHCLESATGKDIWRYQVSTNRYFAAATSDPVITGKLVILASHDHAVHALDLNTGNEKWVRRETEKEQPGYCSPLLFSDRVYFTSLTGCMYALACESGELVWLADLRSAYSDPVFDSSPVRFKDRLTCGSVNGCLYLLYPQTRDVTVQQLSGDYVFSTLSANKGGIFAASMDGAIYRLNLPWP